MLEMRWVFLVIFFCVARSAGTRASPRRRMLLFCVNSFPVITIFHVRRSIITIQLFEIVPLQFKNTLFQTILYASHPLDPLAGDRICVLPSLPLADAHTRLTRAPTPRRTHLRLSVPLPARRPEP
jgi:hypothetical protein